MDPRVSRAAALVRSLRWDPRVSQAAALVSSLRLDPRVPQLIRVLAAALREGEQQRRLVADAMRQVELPFLVDRGTDDDVATRSEHLEAADQQASHMPQQAQMGSPRAGATGRGFKRRDGWRRELRADSSKGAMAGGASYGQRVFKGRDGWRRELWAEGVRRARWLEARATGRGVQKEATSGRIL